MQVQVSKKHQMVLLDKSMLTEVKEAIPHAVELAQHIAVPHRATETRILNNLGIAVDSPILYYYDWPNAEGYTPYKAQYETSAFLTRYRNAFVLNDMGTGKSNAALWALDMLIQQGDVSKALIVAPLSTLNRVWGDALWLNFPHLKFEVLHGTKTKRLAALNRDSHIYIVNPDGVKILHDELKERTDIDHIICDEIAEYREARTEKYCVLKSLVTAGKSIWGLTGTPTPNAPTDAWSQVKLVNPAAISPYFGRFQQETMIKITQFKWAAKPDAMERVYAAMQPSVRYTRENCLDLPPETHIDLEVELSKEQKEAYKRMAKSLYAEYQQGTISAANEGVKMFKLVQIAAGVVYDDNAAPVLLPCASRLKVLAESVQNSEAKVIVFVPFKEMTNMVASVLRKRWTVAIVNGDVSAPNRDKIFSEFQSSPNPHVLVAHPKCMAHGLTLTEASTIIWYAPYANSADYQQANGRIRRGGQLRNQLYIHLQGSEVERRIYAKLRNQQSAQGVLLDLFEKNMLQ